MSNDYIVQPGDTLSSIARRHGCSVSLLQSTNHVADPRKLRAGAHLQLPNTRQRLEAQRPVDTSLQPPTTPSPDSGSYTRELIQAIEDAEGVAEVDLQTAVQKAVRIGHGLDETVLQWLREVESSEATHTSASTSSGQRPSGQQRRSTPPVVPPIQPPAHAPAARPQAGPDDQHATPHAVTPTHHPATPPRRHKDQVIADLHTRLFATPHVVSTTGVALSRNERRMLVAAAGLCEANGDVFGSSNTDEEFVGRKFGKRGSEQKYSRIVHIGLSYGYIQCSQDSGSLGALLVKMRQRDRALFTSYFPNTESLIQMTTRGLPGHDRYGLSGQTYWNRLSHPEQQGSRSRANTDADHDNRADNPLTADEEIRGARVQKIPYVEGYPAIDLWEDYAEKPYLPNSRQSDYFGYLSAFKAAGEVPAFQDVQLDFAVENYLNPVLDRCRQWRVRSSLGLAFILACSIRGGSGLTSRLVPLLLRVASALAGHELSSFESAQHEHACVKALADCYDSYPPRQRPATATMGSGSTMVTFDMDEGRRAKVLLADQYHFLTEDLYDLATYDAAHDH